MINHIVILAIEARHVYDLNVLPMHHRDPFDRLLIAQARVEGAVLVTSDEAISAYDVQTIWD